VTAGNGAAALPPVAVVQNAYVVPDLVAGCRRLHELYRIGPFLRIGRHELRDAFYRGQPAPEPVVIEAAFAQSGELSIEVIQQLSPGPSAFRDMFGPGEHGLHHVATWATDWNAERAAFIAAGYEIAMESAGRGDYRICYVDARPTLGHMIELYPDHPDLRAVYRRVAEATAAWDGVELFQPMTPSTA
jgi:hypothetical protein